MEPKNFKTILLDYLTITDLNDVLKNLSIDTQFNSKIDQIQAIDKELKTNIHELIMNINLKGINTLIEKYKLDYAKNKSLYNKKRAILTHLLANYHSQFNSNLDEVKIRLSGLFESDDKNSMYESIFKLENFLYKKKDDLKFPKLNPEYISKSILESLKTANNIKELKEFIAIDYEASALIFLKNKIKEVHRPLFQIELANDYFKQSSILELLNIKDIEILRTGNTRCKANFAQAVNQLSKLGLIIKSNISRIEKNNGHKYLPNTLGIFLAEFIKANYDQIKSNHQYQSWEFPRDYNLPKHLRNFVLNPIIHAAILTMNDSKLIEDFIEARFNYLTIEQKKLLKHTIAAYIDLFDKEVIVEDNKGEKIIRNNQWGPDFEITIGKIINNSDYIALTKRIWSNENIFLKSPEDMKLFY